MVILRVLLCIVTCLIIEACGNGTSDKSQAYYDNSADSVPSYASIPDAYTKNLNPKTWYIEPGESIQDIIDIANPDDKLIIMPGVHIQSIGTHDAALFIDKAIDIEIKKGAEIQAVLPSKQTIEPFIITNQSPVPVQEGNITLSYPTIPASSVSYLIAVTSSGLSWAVTSSDTPSVWQGQDIAISPNTPIALENGLTITPSKVLPIGARYYVIFEKHPYFVIRIGDGYQEKYISRVNIHGEGIINQNIYVYGTQTAHAKMLSSGVLVHGRVRDSVIDGIMLSNCQRAVQIYSEHTGTYLENGQTIDGTPYGAERITITNLTINNSIDGILVGHPEHRGFTKDIVVSNNHISVDGVGIEPNFRLYGFSVSNNTTTSIYGPFAIVLWRGPSNGIVNGNTFINKSNISKECVNVSSPGEWPKSKNIVLDNNVVIQ